ncbi:MAG: GAF domain-containing sensor histidine kinase [Acidobacteriota bacterium]|nr:GAF domain-containing sensor histidine kinase [Acidobacteriota bacterium]
MLADYPESPAWGRRDTSLSQLIDHCSAIIDDTRTDHRADVDGCFRCLKKYALCLTGRAGLEILANLPECGRDDDEETIRQAALFSVHFWSGNYREAVRINLPNLIAAKQSEVSPVSDPEMLTAVLFARLHDRVGPTERASYLEYINLICSRLEKAADPPPENDAHRRLLLQAELARLNKRPAREISRLFEHAADTALQSGFLQYAALANEQHGRFWLISRRSKYAEIHLKEARYFYKRWGAAVCVQRLENEFSFMDLSAPITIDRHTLATETVKTSGNEDDCLDFEAVMKTTRAISSEMEPTQLLRVIMHTVAESSGARKGVLLLYRGNQLFVEATTDIAGSGTRIHGDLPFQDSGLAPESLVRYAVRSRENLVFHDERQLTRFTRDPYFAENMPLSSLCMPIVHQDSVRGALYLENNLVRRAFTEGRVDLLGILLAQATISLENARLYDETCSWNEVLEERVEERTRQLEETQQEVVEKARMAGMADIAVNVLHNLGNALNSVVISTQALHKNLTSSRQEGLRRATGMLETLFPDSYRRKEPRAGRLVEYYHTMSDMLQQEKLDNLNYLTRIEELVEDIRNVIASQEHYVSGGGQAEEVRLSRILEEAVSVCEGLLTRREVHLERVIRRDPPVTVQRVKMAHVFTNIIENAVWAMNNQPPEERFLEIELDVEDDHAQIKFTDNGEGIEPDLLDRIFAHGFTTREKGKGYGLHICANAMAEMGGRISAGSPGRGKGATFCISLPTRNTKKLPVS